MTRDSIELPILAAATNAIVTAKLFAGISDGNLERYRTKWLPILKERRSKAIQMRREGKLVRMVEDAHWDWSKKVAAERAASLVYQSFALECEEETQGLMLLEFTHRSRISPPQHLVYIDYLSVAPWNRPWLDEPQIFKGIGPVLVRHAVGTSIREGFQGRIGLHSLPGAVDFYTRIKMTSFGADPNYHNLNYFEFSIEQANEFLSEKNQKKEDRKEERHV